jgi:pimeloyl-ACP methyl ester carboxylesterase
MTGPVCIEFKTADGARLAGDVYPPPGRPRGGVVLVHGFSATRRLDAVVQHAEALADAGFIVLAYDGRGHGMSSGECTLGQLEVHDVAAAVALLRRQMPRIVTVGASMGALAVLAHALEDPELAGVVLVSIPTATWRSMLTARAAAAAVLTRTRAGRAYLRRTTGIRVSADWQRGELPTVQVSRLRMPVAIVHGRRDLMIRSAAAMAVYRAAAEPRRLDLVTGLGHAFQSEGVAAVVRSVEWAFDPSTHPPLQAPDPPSRHR